MPELPDVEGFRRVLMSHAVGLPIEHVDVQDEGVLHDVTAGQLQDKLRGRRFDEPRRHGKWLIVPVGKRSMLLPGPTLHVGSGVRWRVSEAAERVGEDRLVEADAGGEPSAEDGKHPVG
jgi:formamidopyrimidine-DNA glycosylase